MRTQTISFPERQVLCVIPEKLEDLAEAITGMGLEHSHPVIVLLGGDIQAPQATATEQVIITLAKIAEDMKALVICGGVDTGVMAKIGQMRSKNQYQFPLVGITLEALVTWPGGPHSTNLLWWGTKRWQLEPHYSHFILVPGSEPGDESPWVVEAATILSKGHPSVTILINGGEISRKDVALSIEHGRPVIALGGTGQLANDLAMEPERNKLISVVPVHDESRLSKSIQTALSEPLAPIAE